MKSKERKKKRQQEPTVKEEGGGIAEAKGKEKAEKVLIA